MTAHVLAVDGSHLVMRAFHVTPRPADGEAEGAALARRLADTPEQVRRMLARLVSATGCDLLVVAVDTEVPTWRHALDPLYKAPDPSRRGPTSTVVLDALAEHWPRWGVAVAKADGWAADDLLAALVSRCGETGTNATVVSGDRDLLQLAPHARVLCPMPGKGEVHATPEWVRERCGVWPDQIPCWKALSGDKTDGIPRLGLPKQTAGGTRFYGFTEERAAELVATHEDLEGVYAEAFSLPCADERAWLAAGRERAYLSRHLARLDAAAPMELRRGEMKVSRLRINS
jgi:DNA polymerase I